MLMPYRRHCAIWCTLKVSFSRFIALPLMETELAALQAQLAAERAARIAAETQLQAIAQQHQLLLATTPHMTWFKDRAGRYVFCSDSFLEFLRLRREQVIGRTASDIFPADYAADLEANDRHAQRAGSVLAIAGYVRSGQRLCWIETQKTPVYDDQGELLGILGTSIDVTLHHTTEELLARHARCAEGLARCSQDLLRDRTRATATSTALTATLRHLLRAVGAERAAIYACRSSIQPALLNVLVQVRSDPNSATAGSSTELRLPERVRIALEARCAWGGAAPHSAGEGELPLLLLPLHVDGDWWGCLALERAPEEPAWHPQELQALEVAAEMISAFLQSRNKTEALQRRIAELTTLNRIVQAVTNWSDLRRGLKQVGKLVRDLFHASLVTVWLHDGRHGQLRREVYVGPAQTMYSARTLDVVTSAVAQYVLAHEAAQVVDGAISDPLLSERSPPARPAPALVTRLQFRGDPLGILVIRARTPDQHFAVADIALAETIAGTLTSALINIRLLATEQRQRRLAESLQQVALDLSANVDFAALTRAIFAQLQRVLPCESAMLLLQHNNVLHVTAGIGSAAEHIGRRITLNDAEQVVRTFPLRQPRREQSEQQWGAHDRGRRGSVDPAAPGAPTTSAPAWLPWETDGNASNWIGAPLFYGQISLGLLAVDCCASDLTVDEALVTLQTFAGHVAIAIANTQRYEAAAERAVERERQHLARELHDSVSQSLYFANLAAEALPVIWELDPEEGRQRLAELQRFTRSAQAEMRTLLIELRPDLLVNLPLHDALWRLIAVLTAKIAEIRLDVQINLVPALPPDVQIALYRIAQEALSNVVKHARAAQVQFRLDVTPTYAPNQPWSGTVTLDITDDGRGFNPAQIAPGRLGLTSLIERAADIGATLTVESKPGGGTQVLVVWEGMSQEAGARSQKSEVRR
jgi:PAS domain S-box-containing protein